MNDLSENKPRQIKTIEVRFNLELEKVDINTSFILEYKIIYIKLMKREK